MGWVVRMEKDVLTVVRIGYALRSGGQRFTRLDVLYTVTCSLQELVVLAFLNLKITIFFVFLFRSSESNVEDLEQTSLELFQDLQSRAASIGSAVCIQSCFRGKTLARVMKTLKQISCSYCLNAGKAAYENVRNCAYTLVLMVCGSI